MNGKSIALSYLERHGSYINALKAVLDDLDEARRAGRTNDEEQLCEVITVLRELNED